MTLNGFHNFWDAIPYIIRQFEKKSENPEMAISPNCLFVSSEDSGQFYTFRPEDQVIKVIKIIIYACAYTYKYVCACGHVGVCNRRTKLTKIVRVTLTFKHISFFLSQFFSSLAVTLGEVAASSGKAKCRRRAPA